MNRNLWITLGGGVVVLICVVSHRQFSASDELSGRVNPSQLSANDSNGNRFKSEERIKNVERNRPKKSNDVAEILARRSRLGEDFSGELLFREQRKLTESAITTLNDVDLLEFYKGLFSQGGGGIDFNWALSVGLERIFGKGKDNEVFDWIANEQNKILKDKILYYAGQAYYGEDFDRFFDQIQDPSSKSILLAGNCAQIAIGNLPEAIKTYIERSPKGANYSFLKQVFARCGADADYESGSALIPSDSRQIAAETRAALFQKWAEFAPRNTAEFIVRSDDSVSPRQLEPVMQRWFESDSSGAIAWGISMESGECKDICLKSLASSLAIANPENAWDIAMQIGDSDVRKNVLNGVRNHWIKLDPSMAESARIEISN